MSQRQEEFVSLGLNFEGTKTSPKQRCGKSVFPPAAHCHADGERRLAGLRPVRALPHALCLCPWAAVNAVWAEPPPRRGGAVKDGGTGLAGDKRPEWFVLPVQKEGEPQKKERESLHGSSSAFFYVLNCF